MALLFAIVAGVSALVAGGTTYIFTKSSSAAANEEIKGQIVIVNEEHKLKNQTQDILIIVAFALLLLMSIAIGVRLFVQRTFRRARDQADIALQNV